MQTLIEAIKLNNRVIDVNFLIANPDIDLNESDEEGNTALHLIIANDAAKKHFKQKERQDIVKLLIDNNANINVKNKKFEMPFQLALMQGEVEIINLLIEKDVKVRPEYPGGNTELHLVINSQKFVDNNDVKIIKKLIDKGVKVDAQNVNGNTALHLAAYAQKGLIINLLIENNACLTIKNTRNKEPLDYINENLDMINEPLGDLDIRKTINKKNYENNLIFCRLSGAYFGLVFSLTFYCISSIAGRLIVSIIRNPSSTLGKLGYNFLINAFILKSLISVLWIIRCLMQIKLSNPNERSEKFLSELHFLPSIILISILTSIIINIFIYIICSFLIPNRITSWLCEFAFLKSALNSISKYCASLNLLTFESFCCNIFINTLMFTFIFSFIGGTMGYMQLSQHNNAPISNFFSGARCGALISLVMSTILGGAFYTMGKCNLFNKLIGSRTPNFLRSTLEYCTFITSNSSQFAYKTTSSLVSFILLSSLLGALINYMKTIIYPNINPKSYYVNAEYGAIAGICLSVVLAGAIYAMDRYSYFDKLISSETTSASLKKLAECFAGVSSTSYKFTAQVIMPAALLVSVLVVVGGAVGSIKPAISPP